MAKSTTTKSKKTAHYYEFIVEGEGMFPIDMLRRDRCIPLWEVSSEAIIDSWFHSRKVRSINLYSRIEPDKARWESFGWKVTKCENKAVDG